MIRHTKSLVAYRESSQGFLDFVALVSHAVPRLSTSLNAGESPPKPDHFQRKPNKREALEASIVLYEGELARTTLITVFSYFEMYIRSALVEVLEFHGGKEAFIATALRRSQRFLGPLAMEVAASKAKLQEREKKAKRDRYVKHTRILNTHCYRFPTELLSPYGVRQLAAKATNKKGLRAYEIPEVLEFGLLFPLLTVDAERFHELREKRNAIGHGAGATLDLR